MAVALIFLLFMVVFAVGAIIMIKKTLAKVDAESGVSMDPSSIKTSQEFLPFDKIEDDLIDLGGFRYKKIIECTSINYTLKTEMEKEMVEASFARFLNCFQFPISFYIQTREMDMQEYLLRLKDNIEEVCDTFPILAITCIALLNPFILFCSSFLNFTTFILISSSNESKSNILSFTKSFN